MSKPKRASVRGIPEIHHEAVLRLSAEGKSQRAIAQWLEAEHGVKVDHVSVGRLIRSIKSERREATEAVIADRVAKSATSDLDILENLQKDLLDLWENAKKPDEGGKVDVQAALPVADRLLSVTTTKMKAVGMADEKTPKSLSSLLALAFEN